MKKYIVYYRYTDVEAGNKCNHQFKEFDDITSAVNFWNGLTHTSEKYILRSVTWKTEITDITESYEKKEPISE